jgi:hypothetical protein
MDHIPEAENDDEDANKDWLIVEEKKDTEIRPKIELKEIAGELGKKIEEDEFDSLKGEMPVPVMRGRTLSDEGF